jgi:hypothetical protein
MIATLGLRPELRHRYPAHRPGPAARRGIGRRPLQQSRKPTGTARIHPVLTLYLRVRGSRLRRPRGKKIRTGAQLQPSATRADTPGMSSFSSARLTGSGFAQSILLHGRPLLSSGPTVERLPAIKIAGPFRDADVRGRVTAWYRHPDRSEIRWRYRKAGARFSLLSIVEVLEWIDPSPATIDDAPPGARKAESWARAARLLRSEPKALAGDWGRLGIEQWSFHDGSPEVALVERHVARRIGGRVEWQAQVMPVAALAVVADHHDDIAIAFQGARAHAPRRLAERRRRALSDEF